MTELASYLKIKFEKGKRGKQAAFARKTEISDGTISRWKEDRTPTFDSCLLIADYFELSPEEVFRMAERSDYTKLYRRFFPEYRKQDCSETDLYPEEHVEAHQILRDALTNAKNGDFNWIVDSVKRLAETVRLKKEAAEREAEVLKKAGTG